jgi:tetratricopeptide (TPR) repeat protein
VSIPTYFALFACIGLLGTPLVAQETPSSPAATAIRLFLQGDYPTAQAAFEELIPQLSGAARAAAVGGLAEVHAATGEYDLAIDVLRTELAADADNVELWGRLAELQFLTGDWDAAQTSAEHAVRRDTDAIRGRLVLAHLHRESGRMTEALEGYRWCVRYYNRKQPRDAETLRLVAAGSLEYARWKGVSSVFHFVLNTLCPDALSSAPQDWRTAVLSGDLLLEKYNEPQATPEYEAALQLNALSAETHLGLAKSALQRHEADAARTSAEQALVINPRLLGALLVMAELELDAQNIDAAQTFVDRARQSNPRDQRMLACQAMCDLHRDGLPSIERFTSLMAAVARPANPALQPDSAFERLTLEVLSRNPRPGPYLYALGEYFEARTKYDLAVAAYETAVAVMPELAAARTNLGLLNMRIGKVAEAEKILDSAFKSDPFHVRVSNMRKVIGVLNGYDTLRTEHFVIRVDKSDRLLGEYMAEYLEDLHAELTAAYGFTPHSPTQFEIFSNAQGQTAHQWFSARMTGLPWIQTIGASTGRIVALASPSAVDETFNWGRVLRHEFVHIITLQQTDFEIPHWYTEALAVRTEGVVLNQEWKDLLVQRVQAGEVFNLQSINDGFRRPEGPDDWNLAYCQSRHYARMLEQQWGEASLLKLVDAYQSGATTAAAVRSVTGLELAEFEQRYTTYLANLVDEIVRSQAKPEIDLDAARTAWEADRGDAALSGRYAYALWQSGQDQEARAQAETTYDFESGEPLATVVLLHFADQDGEQELAEALIAEAHQSEQPNAVLLGFLAERAFNAGDAPKAETLFRLGVEKFPWEDAFQQGLAVTLIAQQQIPDALPLMAEMADRDQENLTVRTHLATEHFAIGHVAEARRWAREILFLDLEHPTAHVVLGRCWLSESKLQLAREEFARALEFDPANIAAELGLVRCDLSAGDAKAAAERLGRVLRAHPGHKEALTLQAELDGPRN